MKTLKLQLVKCCRPYTVRYHVTPILIVSSVTCCFLSPNQKCWLEPRKLCMAWGPDSLKIALPYKYPPDDFDHLVRAFSASRRCLTHGWWERGSRPFLILLPSLGEPSHQRSARHQCFRKGVKTLNLLMGCLMFYLLLLLWFFKNCFQYRFYCKHP